MMKRFLAVILALSLLSCFAYASTPPDIVPPSFEVIAPTDPPPPVEDGTTPVDPLPPVEDGTAPVDPPPPVEDGTAPVDPLPPVEDGTAPVDPLPPVEDGTAPTYPSPYSDPEIVALLSSILDRIDLVLFTLLPFATAVLLVVLFCWWIKNTFIDSVDTL